MRNFCSFLFFLTFSFASLALIPEKRLENIEDEKRAIEIFKEVKCLVCKAQSVEDSDTEFSYNMRKLIREKIEEGKSDEEIKQELKKEFGDGVFMSENDFLMWFLPFLFAILFGVFLIGRFGR